MKSKPKNPEEDWVDPYPKKKKLGWLTTIVLLLVVYVLSTGPALILNFKGYLPTQGIEIFYAPLDALSRTCPPIEQFMRWYIRDVWQINGITEIRR